MPMPPYSQESEQSHETIALVEPTPCRRVECTHPTVGKGLCARHYARWHYGEDTLDMPGDAAPSPPTRFWQPPR